jgi:hypothetical protein
LFFSWLKFFSAPVRNLSNFQFVMYLDTKKVKTINLLFPLLFCCWIQDEHKSEFGIDFIISGSGVNIPDPQHCVTLLSNRKEPRFLFSCLATNVLNFLILDIQLKCDLPTSTVHAYIIK